jgi:acyl-CoA thioester hydrolase
VTRSVQPPPFSVPVQVRWRDLDAFRHVNNAALVSYLEVARSELWRHHFEGADPMDIPFVIARLEVDYKRPVGLYDEVVVALTAADIGATSFAFDYVVTANGLAAATARTVQVCVRHASGRPVRVPEALRRRLGRFVAPAVGGAATV